jgi:ABC-2 type transport system permease protein
MVIFQNRLVKLITGIVLLLLVNLLAQYAYTRIDFTREKRYTLNPKTEAILQQAEQEINVTVFLDGDLPAAFKRLKLATADLLNDYKALANVRINVVFADPISGLPLNEQDTVINRLYSIGVEPTTLNIKNDNGFAQKTIFPMAVVSSEGRQLPVKLLQNMDAAGSYEDNINSSIQNLEYTFTSAIKKVVTGENPRIGFTEGNGELSDLQLSDALKSLSTTYEAGRVDLGVIDKAGLDRLKILFVTKPQRAFTEAEKYKLDYFVMKGGSLVWSIDQVSADLDSLRGKTEQLAFNKALNLDDMLFIYGARINYNLVADANCAEIPLAMGDGNQNQIQLAPWLYYPILLPDTASALVKNIDGVRAEFVSTIDTIGVKGVHKTTILSTSPYNKLHNAPKLLSLQMVAEQPDPRDYASTSKPVGVLMEGSFPSVFYNRALPAGIPASYGNFEKSKPTRMIVIGDGDIFKNQVSATDNSVFPLGFDRFTQQNFGNKALLLNIADYLSSEDNLIALRNKDIKVRLLDKTRVRSEKLTWQIMNALLPIGLLVLFGIFQHYYRKYKYTR